MLEHGRYRDAPQHHYLGWVIRTCTLEEARANRRHLVLANGAGYWRSDFIRGERGPQAFLVEQDPNSEILTHYHEENEFQVFVKGGGTMGRSAIIPTTVHYAGRHTGYGPIHSGPQGLWYFSLRANTDPGARFLPEWRDRMEKGPKRHLMGATIEPQPDGIAAWVSSKNDFPARPGAARFYIDLSSLAVAFADEPFEFQGASNVLCVQFPC